MDKFLKSIDKQINSNRGKNIFLIDENLSLKFIDDTINAISAISEVNSDSEILLIDYATDKSLQEFCRVNQYYSFNSQAKKELRDIYADLFSNIRNSKASTDIISKNHYQKLKQWLQKTNRFAEKIYSNNNEVIVPIACSEYSPDLQIDILHLDIKRLMEPVLDIGCGKQGNLVNYLLQNGFEAYGIDRFSFTEPYLISSDWLEYNFGTEKWGTIISNLGFSNHFKHHNLREDGNYIEYGKTYMDILCSLKVGGMFHYAPDLPFIEKYLDNNKFSLIQHTIGGLDYKVSIIKRLRK